MKIRLIDKISPKVDKPLAYIKAGKVLVNKQKVEDGNYIVQDNDVITIQETKKYVSRGAYKLLAAIELFNMDFHDQVILDIGASTGGFTQVALEHGAQKVYALDVGTNQLDFKLRTDQRVVVLEKTHLKTIQQTMFKETINIVVVDVSFISLRRVFDVLASWQHLQVMALIKPQFEALRDEVAPGGFVDEKKHDKIISKIKTYALKKNFQLVKIAKSPLKGGKSKNQEYISLFMKE